MEDFDDDPELEPPMVDWMPCTVCGASAGELEDNVDDEDVAREVLLGLGWEELETGWWCLGCIQAAKDFEERQKQEGAESGTSFSVAADAVERAAGIEGKLSKGARKKLDDALLNVAKKKHRPKQPRKGYKSPDAIKVKVKRRKR